MAIISNNQNIIEKTTTKHAKIKAKTVFFSKEILMVAYDRQEYAIS